jgi:hypothetical protein
LRQHYEGIADESPAVREKDMMRRRLGGGMKQVEIVDAWIGLKEELDTPWVDTARWFIWLIGREECADARIPRAEVEEIGRCVKEHLDAIMPGCRYTLTGG